MEDMQMSLINVIAITAANQSITRVSTVVISNVTYLPS